MVVMLEPFTDNSKLHYCKNNLAMDQATCNSNGKIWVFWGHNLTYKILENDEQQVTCEIQYTQIPHKYITTFVYAKCYEHLRRPLWDMM